MKRLLTLFICCCPLLFSVFTAQAGIKLVGADRDANYRLSEKYYGPIRKYETLWSIANKLKPNDSVTIYQTFIAIYKINPYAFQDGNVNKIIKHFTLKVPTLAFIKKQNDRAARILIRRSKRKKSRKVVKQAIKQNPKSSSAIAPKVKQKAAVLVTAGESATKTVSTPATPSALNLVLNKKIMNLKNSLELMNEKLITHNKINKILRTKIENLTEQVKNLNKQLASEITLHEEFSDSKNKYIKKLESIVPAPFGGEGMVNGILHAITSSVIYLLLILLLPIILLIIIFILILRKKTKALTNPQEENVPESSVPESSVPESSVPESSVPESSVPESSVPESSEPVNEKSSMDNDSNSMDNNTKEAPLEQENTTKDGSLSWDNEDTEPLWNAEELEQTSQLVNLDEKEDLLTENDLDLSDLDELDTLGDPELNSSSEEPFDIELTEMDLLDTQEDENSSELDMLDSQTAKVDEFDIGGNDLTDLDLTDDKAPEISPEKAESELSVNEEEPFIDIEKLLEESESASSSDDFEGGLKGKDDLEDLLKEIEETNDGENKISAQLDLARAYLEIDDKSGAKEILEGLSGEGTAVEQEEIDILLKKLD